MDTDSPVSLGGILLHLPVGCGLCWLTDLPALSEPLHVSERHSGRWPFADGPRVCVEAFRRSLTEFFRALRGESHKAAA